MTSQKSTLVIHSWNAGFFSNFNGVLNNLRYRLGRGGIVAAIVNWPSLGRPSEVPGDTVEGSNLWLQFFERLSFDEFPERTIKATGFATEKMTGRRAYRMYKLDRRWRSVYHALYRRHIRIRPAILDQVEEIYRARMKGNFCAGVHYRHPAHDAECLHRIASPKVFIERLRRQLPVDQPWVVFLATDMTAALVAFDRAFGSRLVIQPGVHRAGLVAEGTLRLDQERPDIGLAREVLVDCLLLARCDMLLHVTSNVATAAGYVNPALRMVYCETHGQAAWGYVWSIFLSSRRADWLSRWLPLAFRAAHRRSRNVGRWIAGRPLIARPAAPKRAGPSSAEAPPPA
jgi:hypothetical protein